MREGGIKKIAVIGSPGGGKTTMSQKLAQVYDLPALYIDLVQYSGGELRPAPETIRVVDHVLTQEKWLIEGYGPLANIEERLRQADRIIFIDFPLLKHCFWCAKREVGLAFTSKYPGGFFKKCGGVLWVILELLNTIRIVHGKIRPGVIKLLETKGLQGKTVWVRSQRSWDRLFSEGFGHQGRGTE